MRREARSLPACSDSLLPCCGIDKDHPGHHACASRPARLICAAIFRFSIGLTEFGRLSQSSRLASASRTSGRRFAVGFLHRPAAFPTLPNRRILPCAGDQRAFAAQARVRCWTRQKETPCKSRVLRGLLFGLTAFSSGRRLTPTRSWQAACRSHRRRRD